MECTHPQTHTHRCGQKFQTLPVLLLILGVTFQFHLCFYATVLCMYHSVFLLVSQVSSSSFSVLVAALHERGPEINFQELNLGERISTSPFGEVSFLRNGLLFCQYCISRIHICIDLRLNERLTSDSHEQLTSEKPRFSHRRGLKVL